MRLDYCHSFTAARRRAIAASFAAAGFFFLRGADQFRNQFSCALVVQTKEHLKIRAGNKCADGPPSVLRFHLLGCLEIHPRWDIAAPYRVEFLWQIRDRRHVPELVQK